MHTTGSPSPVIARFRDAAGQEVLGPLFGAQEADCRACLHTRIASCGLAAPRFVPCTALPFEVGDVLETHAALTGGGVATMALLLGLGFVAHLADTIMRLRD